MLIPITSIDLITADRLATTREYYEYRRQGEGYNYNGTTFHQAVNQKYGLNLTSQSNVFAGILFELCLFKAIVNSVMTLIANEANYNNNANPQEYMRHSLLSKAFSHDMAVGKYDDGYDFLLMNYNGGEKIDAKVYPSRILENPQTCLNYNLLVDNDQYDRHGSNIYIQGFILTDVNLLRFYVAGWEYSDNLVPYNNIPNPGHGARVTNLRGINELINMIYQNNFDPAQYQPF